MNHRIQPVLFGREQLATWNAEALMRLFRERVLADPGRHRTHFYAYYANRVRGDRAALEPGEPTAEEQPAKKRRCSASWAGLISKLLHVDPLACAKCGGKLEVIAYLHDQVSISKILHHLGLGPPETAKPPPALHEVVRVPVDEEGRELAAP